MKPNILHPPSAVKGRLSRPLAALCMALAATAADAAVITALGNSEAIPFTEVTQPDGTNTTNGPIVDGKITWSSVSADYEPDISVYGYTGSYGFGDNGTWNGLSMIGTNNDYGTMTVTFQNPVSAVLAFLNYAVDVLGPVGTTPSIAVYDANDTLIESLVLSFLTGGGDNTGQYLGFSESGAIIKSMTFTGAFIGATDLQVAQVPEPPVLALLGLGLVGIALARKRKPA